MQAYSIHKKWQASANPGLEVRPCGNATLLSDPKIAPQCSGFTTTCMMMTMVVATLMKMIIVMCSLAFKLYNCVCRCKHHNHISIISQRQMHIGSLTWYLFITSNGTPISYTMRWSFQWPGLITEINLLRLCN